jgi:hypothetical protein
MLHCPFSPLVCCGDEGNEGTSYGQFQRLERRKRRLAAMHTTLHEERHARQRTLVKYLRQRTGSLPAGSMFFQDLHTWLTGVEHHCTQLKVVVHAELLLLACGLECNDHWRCTAPCSAVYVVVLLVLPVKGAGCIVSLCDVLHAVRC